MRKFLLLFLMLASLATAGDKKREGENPALKKVVGNMLATKIDTLVFGPGELLVVDSVIVIVKRVNLAIEKVEEYANLKPVDSTSSVKNTPIPGAIDPLSSVEKEK